MNAIPFLYRHVLDHPLVDGLSPVRSRRSKRLPTVLSAEEMRSLLARRHSSHELVTETMYAGGLRLGEALRLRVHDLDNHLKRCRT